MLGNICWTNLYLSTHRKYSVKVIFFLRSRAVLCYSDNRDLCNGIYFLHQTRWNISPILSRGRHFFPFTVSVGCKCNSTPHTKVENCLTRHCFLVLFWIAYLHFVSDIVNTTFVFYFLNVECRSHVFSWLCKFCFMCVYLYITAKSKKHLY